MVFAHLGTAWAPCGQLVLTEDADRLLASSFAYGLNYLKRSDALEVDPVSLSLTEAGVPAAEQDKIASAFRHIDDVSTAALRKQLP